jgi:tRNA-intron endonuclease
MMQGVLSGGKVIVADSEVGAPATGDDRRRGWLELEEAAGLLETGRMEINDEEGKELNPDEFLKRALAISPKFGLRYIVYNDLKERGYVVQPGGVDFWLYPRGVKPGEKPARYFIRILSESDFISLKELVELLILACNMRKEPILAVVDEESDITYYEVKEAKFENQEARKEEIRKVKATLFGDRVLLWDADLAETLYRTYFYGNLTKEKRLLLSFLEAAYLMRRGLLEIEVREQKSENRSPKSEMTNARSPNSQLSTLNSQPFEQFIEYASAIESDFMDKYRVYADLMEKGQMVKTGFKFGSHFRVYKAMQLKHSLYLIHVLSEEHVFPLPELSRAVRLAHGVRKRMIFAFTVAGEIRYVDVGRMKL